MKKKGARQVSPKTAALVILTVLIVVQIVWWRGLIMPEKPVRGGGPQTSIAPSLDKHPVLYGRKDVRVETFSGGPEPGWRDGPGNAARFATPTGLALSHDGSLIVADTLNHVIRRVTASGMTSTLAGGLPGYVDGPAANARFNMPCGVTCGPDGAIYVADTGNHRIRRIKEGLVTTLAGGEAGMADGAGAAARFRLPAALAYQEGAPPHLIVADAGNRRVRILTTAGEARPGGWNVNGTPVSLAPDGGNAFAVSGVGIVFPKGKVLHSVPIEMQGKAAEKPAEYTLRNPATICAGRDGWFVSAFGHAAIFHFQSGSAEVIAGRVQGPLLAAGWRDGDGSESWFGEIGGIVSDGRGHLFVSDTGNHCIRRVTLPLALSGTPISASHTGKEPRP